MTRALLPALEHSGQGHIVNVGSVAGFEVYEGGAGYTGAKHAERALTRTLRLELLGKPIRVTDISPGLVETGLHAANGKPQRLERLKPTIPMGRAGRPEEIAEAIVWLLSSAASYVTGTVLEVGGGR